MIFKIKKRATLNLAVRPPSLKNKKRNLGFTPLEISNSNGIEKLKGKNRRQSKSLTGFTLIELLIVIAIIGLLSSVVLASLNSARKKARDARRISDFKQIMLALEMFYDAENSYPQVSGAGNWIDVYNRLIDCLENKNQCGFVASNYTPAISKVPQDPLGTTRTYYYYHCSSGQRYRLRAVLEQTSPVLNSDLDGAFYGADDTSCADGSFQYCVGTGEWCW